MASNPRRPMGTFEKAEALFKAATTKPIEGPPKEKGHVIPSGKETVSLRLDRDLIAHFQDDGPGWQDRINAALRKAVGLE
jgi:uncharacterized protein (DUF4415 family)